MYGMSDAYGPRDGFVEMPIKLTSELIAAVRKNELCKVDDKDEMHKRIGWLVCAYDAMVAAQRKGSKDPA